MVYVAVLDADDNGDTFAYARQVRLGPAVEPWPLGPWRAQRSHLI